MAHAGVEYCPVPARAQDSPTPVRLSLVVPLYDEEENVTLLHEAVTVALADYQWRYEMVLVDDGSHDDTFKRACMLVDRDPRVRVVGLRRNFGQTAAMAAGIRAARGETIVTMDGDLQNDPNDIPRLVAMLDDGFDLAAGWRKDRQDEGKRVFISRIANRIINTVLGVQVRDSGCSLKAYRAELIQSLPLYGEMHRFIPALAQLAGSRTAQIPVRHHARRFGKSKYGFSRIYKVMLDIISIRFLITYARHPIRSMVWPATALVLPGLVALGLVSVQPHSSLMLSGVAALLLTSAGFMMCLGCAGLVFTMFEPRIAEFALVAANIWRQGTPAAESEYRA